MDVSFEQQSASADGSRTDRALGFHPSQTNLSLKRGVRSDANMLLLRGLLDRLIRKGKLTVISPAGRKYDFGAGLPSVTISIAEFGDGAASILQSRPRAWRGLHGWRAPR